MNIKRKEVRSKGRVEVDTNEIEEKGGKGRGRERRKGGRKESSFSQGVL